MKHNYAFGTSYAAKSIFTSVIIIIFCSAFTVANAQTLYRAVSASQIDINALTPSESNKGIISEGTYLIKDGQLDELYNLKLILQTSILDSLLGGKKVTFEQTRVMVLPIMGMVHVVGVLDVDGLKTTTSFQLGFSINSDQSITFKGNKLLKMNELVKEFPSSELKLDIDFVLKNTKNNLAALKAK
ncbi:MAG: hypothetical protein EOO07_28945 [Chitinophagaceae bacterium]|nr:MAG: hypothetical protein EOO07_28945 [Chitinophagaceae bacterium]